MRHYIDSKCFVYKIFVTAKFFKTFFSVAIHEAMEQQTVSVAKAGIVCSLNARTAVLASANPRDSAYDPKKSVVDNINLPKNLMTRFDFIWLMIGVKSLSYPVELC
mgnify:CR=1 FL=1